MDGWLLPNGGAMWAGSTLVCGVTAGLIGWSQISSVPVYWHSFHDPHTHQERIEYTDVPRAEFYVTSGATVLMNRYQLTAGIVVDWA